MSGARTAEVWARTCTSWMRGPKRPSSACFFFCMFSGMVDVIIVTAILMVAVTMFVTLVTSEPESGRIPGSDGRS